MSLTQRIALVLFVLAAILVVGEIVRVLLG